VRVLLTGYEPFDGEPVNPSARLAGRLAAAAPPHPSLELAAVVLPVDRARYAEAAARAVRAHAPDLVLALGQATGRDAIDLETTARNAIDYRGGRDNGGHAARGEPLEPGGPARRTSRVALAPLARALAEAGHPVRTSRDAGRHLCNALLYELCRAFPRLPSAFVHVPLLPEQAARRARGEPSLGEERALAALRALLALVGARPLDFLPGDGSMVSIDVTYEGELRCRARHGPSGQQLVTDAPVDNEGRGEAFSPTDLLATALGTCVATIMGIVARRHAIELSGLRVEVDKEMVADPRRRIGRLRVDVRLPDGIDGDRRRLLEEAAAHCPVHHSLHPDVEVVTTFHEARAASGG